MEQLHKGQIALSTGYIYPLYKIFKGFISLIVLSTFRTTDHHIIVGNENTNGNQDLVDLAKDCFEK